METPCFYVSEQHQAQLRYGSDLTLSSTNESFHVEQSFGTRLGYLRWLRHLLTGEAPGHAEIGRAVGLTGQAIMGWAARDEPPDNWRHHEPLAAFFGVDDTWLIRGQGNPPRPELWRAWLEARGATRAGGQGEVPLGMVAEEKKPYGAKRAPIESFRRMSSKELEAAAKKKKPKRA